MYKVIIAVIILLSISCNDGQKQAGKVTNYEAISEYPFLKDAASLTWVKGISPNEALNILVLERKVQNKQFTKRTLEELEPKVRNSNTEAILAGKLSDEWILMIEENTYLERKKLLELSKNREVISVFWNVNGLAELSIIINGELISQLRDIVLFIPDESDAPLAKINEVLGKDPELLIDLVNNLKTVEDFEWKVSVFKWISDYMNTDLPKGWLQKPHETVILKY